MALKLEKSNCHRDDRISPESIDLQPEEISIEFNFEFEIDDDFSNSNGVYERANIANICFSALWFCGIATTHEKMDESENAPTNENSSAHKDKSSEFKFKLFHIEQVECDKSVRFPHPRSGHRIVADEFFIYSFGGFNPSVQRDPFMDGDAVWQRTKPLFQELWKFNKLTQTWSLMEPNKQAGKPPNKLASHSAVLFNKSKMLVYGGSGIPFGQSSSNKLHMVDLTTSKWFKINHKNEKDDVNIPEPGYGQAIALDHYNEKLYVVGGTNGFEYHLDVHVFDRSNQKWTKLSRSLLPPEIKVRYRHELALWDNKLYIIGGGNNLNGFSLEIIPVFDLNTNTWSRVQTNPHLHSTGILEFPLPRYSHDCAQLGSTIYVVGGTHQTTVYNDVWRLDLSTLTWHRLPCSLPTGLYFHSVAITEEGQLSVFGGVNSVETKERNNRYLEIWVQVPKLSSLSRMALFSKLRAKFRDDKKEMKKNVDAYLKKFHISLKHLKLEL